MHKEEKVTKTLDIMTREQIRTDILSKFRQDGIKPGQMVHRNYWNNTYLKRALSEERDLFWSVVADMIDEGLLEGDSASVKSPYGINLQLSALGYEYI